MAFVQQAAAVAPVNGLHVHIKRVGNVLMLSPAPTQLCSQLEFTEMIRLAGMELRHHLSQQRLNGEHHPKPFKFERRRLWEPLPDTETERHRIACPAGLTTRICKWLKANNCTYSIEDTRPALLPPAEFSLISVQHMREGQERALAAMDANDHGTIDMSTGYGKSFMFQFVAEMWPNANIVIVVPRKSILNTVYDYLVKAGIDVGRVGDGKFELRRVIVVVDKSLHKLYGLADQIRVVLCDEVYGAGSPKLSQDLTQFRFARMFGFADGPYTREDGRNMVVESLFGPTIASITYQESVAQAAVTQLEVLMFHVGEFGFSGVVHDTRQDVNKRHSYWRHGGRNAAIAYAAQVGAAHLGVPYTDCQTLITCETTEHALMLKQQLPDFTVCHAGDIEPERREQLVNAGLDEQSINLKAKELPDLQRRFESGELKKVIATPIWSAGVNFQRLQLLIRADGLTSKVANRQLPGRLSRLHDGKDVGLIIDFVDEYNEWAMKRSQSRIALYRSRGWQVTIHPQKLATT